MRTIKSLALVCIAASVSCILTSCGGNEQDMAPSSSTGQSKLSAQSGRLQTKEEACSAIESGMQSFGYRRLNNSGMTPVQLAQMLQKNRDKIAQIAQRINNSTVASAWQSYIDEASPMLDVALSLFIRHGEDLMRDPQRVNSPSDQVKLKEQLGPALAQIKATANPTSLDRLGKASEQFKSVCFNSEKDSTKMPTTSIFMNDFSEDTLKYAVEDINNSLNPNTVRKANPQSTSNKPRP